MEDLMPPRLFRAFISIALSLAAYALIAAILVFFEPTRQFAITMAHIGKVLIGIGGISVLAILLFVWFGHQNKNKNNGKHE
jgi:CHASE2 domain-containing sensor protein